MAWVRFVREGKCIEVEDGCSVLEAEIRAGIRPDAPCGGQGKCGKCLVKLNGKIIKACQVKLNVDMKAEAGKEYLVETLDRSEAAKILTDDAGFAGEGKAWGEEVGLAEIIG